MKTSPLPAKRSWELNIFPTGEEMGKAAARDVCQAMKRFALAKGRFTIVFAAAPSQNEFLSHLSKTKGVVWPQATCFHLDEYADLPRNHPNTFEVYLREHLLTVFTRKRSIS